MLEGISSRTKFWIQIALPPVIFALAAWLFVALSPLERITGDVPPVEDLTVNRTVLRPGRIELHIVNGGLDPVTIAQVMIDEAYWAFSVEPNPLLDRLDRAVVVIPYPWVEGEAHEVALVTNTGLTFAHEIEVATESPEPNRYHWMVFALVGLFVGVIPVGLGLLWFPVLQQLDRKAIRFMLALTVGLLFFLLFDTLFEAMEIAEQVADVFNALPIIFLGALLSFGVLVAIGKRPGVRDRGTPKGRMWIAMAIAIGIGFHNLGEGMAIGAAVALGEVSLGTYLVLGFALHNITEGIGIGAPMALDKPGWKWLALLAVVAGAPAVPGVWIGGFSYSPLLAVLFLAIGAGAILQVVYEVGKLITDSGPAHKAEEGPAFDWINIAGLAAGIVIMYATALLVA